MTSTKLNTLAVSGVTVSKDTLAKLEKLFTTIHYHPDNNVPREEWKNIEIWYTRYDGFPKEVQSVKDIPRTRAIQLTSAGANVALRHPLFQTEQGRKQVKVCSASGIHVLSIPQYILAQAINLYMKIHLQVYLSRKAERWISRGEVPGSVDGRLGAKSLYGKTAGLLGYGHIARETARILKAFNVKVIAANSNGQRRKDEGYIIPGTGDVKGTIPDEYYSTSDPKSFEEFLSKTDILIASLPSTPATRFLLKKEHFDALPDGAIFINVGRGDLAHSEDILAALDSPTGLAGVALDVTDPEPLPDKHPLWSHDRAIVTPHTSGDYEGYFDAGADLLIANVERFRREGKFINVIDPEKGY